MDKTNNDSYLLMLFGQVHACWYIGKSFFWGGVFPTGTNDQHRQLRREALNIVEDSIQDISTCAKEFRLNYQLKTVVFNSGIDFVGPSYQLVLLNNMYICVDLVLRQVEAAARCCPEHLPRANTSFMLVLCSTNSCKGQ